MTIAPSLSKLECALNYAVQGWKVFPLQPGGKAPATSDGFKSATCDPAQINLWWTYNPSYNIGVATGAASGLVVVDVDKKSGGLDTLSKLPTLSTLMSRTTGGGLHYYFNHPGTQVRNKTGLYPGIDIRGDGGYVVAPGSDGYSWTNWGDGAEPKALPAWLSPALTEPTASPRNQPKMVDNDAVVMEGGRNHYLTRLAGKLQRMKLLTLGSLKGLNNRDCEPPLPDSEVEAIYNSVARYKPDSSSESLSPEDQALREFLLRAKAVRNLQGADDIRFVDLTSGVTRIYDPKVVRDVLSKEEYTSLIHKNAIKAELKYSPHTHKSLFHDELGVQVFNTYIPPDWLRTKYYSGEALAVESEPPQEYVQFFQHLTDGHADSYNYLMDWLAKSLTSRNYTILTAIGEQGIGKGTLGTIMQKLHGSHNYVKVRDQVFKGQFNAPLANKTLVYVDEVDLRTKESQDRIKDVVNDIIEIEQKGKDPRAVQNYASFYLSSNTYDAVKIEAGDRRYSVIQLTNHSMAAKPELIALIPTLVTDDNIGRLARYLVQREVSRNMLLPFRSDRYEEVKEAGLAEWERWVLFDFCPKHRGKRFNHRELQTKIMDACDLRSAPGRSKLEGLTKKYPDILAVKKYGNEWEFSPVGEPSAPWTGSTIVT